MVTENPALPSKRQRRWRWLFYIFILGLAGLSSVALIIALLGRKVAADQVVQSYLQQHHVAGSYRITQLDTRHMRLDNVAVGPEHAPDLRLERADVDIIWQGWRPQLGRITLHKPVLQARFDGKKLTLGSLDRLLPQSSGPPKLPFLDVDVRQGTIRLQTPYGPVHGSLNGQGVLANGFRGHVVVAPTDWNLPALRARQLSATVDFTTARQSVAGHYQVIAADALAANCALIMPVVKGDLQTPVDLSHLGNRTTASVRNWRCAQAQGGPMALTLSLAGVLSSLAGDWHLQSEKLATSQGTAQALTAQGALKIQPPLKVGHIDGVITAKGIALTKASLAPLAARRGTGANGPLRMLLDQVLRTGTTALHAFDTSTQIAVALQDRQARVTMTAAQIRSANGVHLDVTPLPALQLDVPTMALNGAANVALLMPGLPSLKLAVTRAKYTPGHPPDIRGQLDMGGLAVGTLRLAPSHVGFALGQQLHLDGTTALDGSWAGVSVQPLLLPFTLVLDQPYALGAGGDSKILASLHLMQPALGWASAAKNSFYINAETFNVDLSGTIRAPTATLVARHIRIKPSSPKAPVGLITLDMADVQAAQAPHGWSVVAKLTDGSATIPAQVLALRKAHARLQWTAREGLQLDQAVATLEDQSPRPRFTPLQFTNLVVQLRGDDASGSTQLMARDKQLLLANIDGRYALSTQAGKMQVTLGPLTFGPDLQPYDLSELLRGVVENVTGTLEGQLAIDIDKKDMQSKAIFNIRDISLATAALGPIRGIDGRIAFDDVLARTTPPGQMIRIATLNPGVVLNDGVIRFQLRPNNVIRLEGAEWPFAGGRLRLEPVDLVPAAPEHRMTISLSGVSIADFLQQFEFKDLNATGHIGGSFPLIFTSAGGRIEHGLLTAEPGGGVIQYVGKVGSEQMGQARIAFDALKSFRYDNITLTVDGALDGELVTSMQFSGVNQIPIHPQTPLLHTTGGTGIPFKFGVNVHAPFRSLFKSAASFSDARALIREGEPVTPDDVPGAPASPPKK